MLSRVAESIYWMSRYLERAENLARLIDVHNHLVLDAPHVDQNVRNWTALVSASGAQEIFRELYEVETREAVVKFLAFDTRHGSSMISCVNSARENARTIREIIAPELWEQINAMYHLLQRYHANPAWDGAERYEFFRQVKMFGLSFGGIVSDTMLHTEGWNWFHLGRMLERGDQTSRILDVKYFMLLPRASDVGSSIDQIHWSGLLKSTSSLECYRSRYGIIDPEKVVGFLLLDREFPRSVRYCIRKADDALRAVLGTFPNHYQNDAEQLLGQLNSDLAYASVESVIKHGLHEFIDKVQLRVNEVGHAIHRAYFSS